MQTIRFWNGNKSAARQSYELALLQACLAASAAQGPELTVHVDNTDYPKAEDEASIFSRGADILVTVAGNRKFSAQRKIVIEKPLTKGLLGYRLLIVCNDRLAQFRQISSATELQALSLGIPRTWADADLFRYNGFNVVERGTFDSLFILLHQRAFDYVALGANEIEDIFQHQVAMPGDMSIEPSLLLYYPFPLLFYVNADQPALAQRVKAGLTAIMNNGEFDVLFQQHHGDVVQRLQLPQRKLIELHNPMLPESMAGFVPELFG